ncbi:ATP-dependent Clp protease ATP-binding subunit [Aneurinibacillus migulanus]|uniref:ATP-dependent Clp protease ATP-binding subunit ClpE n=1 Tax=Aneurinibacillus migulanus TaxID=47500 RepID=A0A0D1VH96_ANEMI|nr:ATP-dependent Clp protease ATP-binding subunit [Aneurinibacillus migulanus]KIV58854.1 Clp protease ClpX [Aneurinibacillus migulanus]KON96547.1 Clp protease ClpX [Aneurinibacillus migulanus]MED0890759.1 ATP-dependent Clp protease ATP-binding subunit [Aneurinibacillus migulanus]MED1618288.1 ATP-dependent Clp protease ATP-binding subunit [Aneurinibacillus migulanus]SDK08680.1 ATP-dependent Clp protease ATP-binding subunit ClpE [Aneurinibacillus migulanus]
MLCQHCNQKQANVLLNIQHQEQSQKLYLCHDCYAKMGNKAGAGMNTGSLPHFSGFDEWFKNFAMPSMDQYEAKGSAQSQAPHQGGVLDEVGNNLSEAAKAGLIDPVIGRDNEIERVIEILNRRNKNNPVLIGEPGVGKTAIAEGLALKIVEGHVPTKLRNKVIYTLDVSSLVAGTGIRGQFEEKMKQMIAELQKRKNVILFVDEIHLLVGAGAAEGSMDAGNILKPALARGELQIVGATTLKEYRKIEKDAALERRLQPVMVKEPTVEEALQILQGIRPKYESYHQVAYSDEVIRACVELSHRYIQDRFLPDKAIDLLDEAGSKINLRSSGQNTEELRSRLAQINQEKVEATAKEEYEHAAQLRDEENHILTKLDEIDGSEQAAVVTVEDIQQIIERKTGIPVRKLQSDEQAKMKNLATHLEEKVVGQSHAVSQVSKAIRRSRTGLKPKNRPIASFLFVGPTGVGKTELTKALAEELFGTKDSMIRLDMSEYMEKHSVSKLIGSPPGYVGHEEAGQLTERVRRNPYSIVLLDEIEKAHPDVQNMFLQILEDGRLTDSQGRTVNFKDTVIIATSNAGVTDKKITVGFGAEAPKTSTVMDSLTSYFRPEFLNRFDGVISFNHLTEDDLVRIVDIMLEDITANLKEQGVEVTVTQESKAKLAKLGYHPAFGARPLRRVIQEHVEDGIADLMIEEEAVARIVIEVNDGEIRAIKKA